RRRVGRPSASLTRPARGAFLGRRARERNQRNRSSGRKEMSDGTAGDGRSDLVDWTRIERSPEFRELVTRRHRFVAGLAGVTFASFGVYLGLAIYASSLMGTTVGGMPIAWLAAMSQVLLTWAVTRL